MSLNLVQAWQGAKKRLEAAGLAGPVIDARLLVEAAADATRADIVRDPYRALTPEARAPGRPHPRGHARRPLPRADARAGSQARDLPAAPRPPRAGQPHPGPQGL